MTAAATLEWPCHGPSLGPSVRPADTRPADAPVHRFTPNPNSFFFHLGRGSKMNFLPGAAGAGVEAWPRGFAPGGRTQAMLKEAR